ncbi:MAG: hypothetical protein AB7N54_20755 [Alphaproteobacteria bacterium]
MRVTRLLAVVVVSSLPGGCGSTATSPTPVTASPAPVAAPQTAQGSTQPPAPPETAVTTSAPANPVNVTGTWTGARPDAFVVDPAITRSPEQTLGCSTDVTVVLSHAGDAVSGTLRSVFAEVSFAPGLSGSCAGYGQLERGWQSAALVSGMARAGTMRLEGINPVSPGGGAGATFVQRIDLTGSYEERSMVLSGFLYSRSWTDANRNGQQDCILTSRLASGECGVEDAFPLTVRVTKAG